MLLLNHLTGFGVGSGVRPFAGATAASVSQSGTSGINGFSYRTVLAPGAISNYGDFSKYAFQSGSGGALTLTKAYVGILANTWDFTTTPKQILFGGGASCVIGAANTEGLSDQMTFAIDPSQSYVVSFYCPSAPAQSAVSGSLPSGWTQYYKNADDAATEAPTGFIANTQITAFKRLEV